MMPPTARERIVLHTGALQVEIAPAVGGSIARFDRARDGLSGAGAGERVPIFRGADGDYDDVLAAGCFPLVPFANRIRGGRFDCDGRTVVLAPNMAGDPSPLHGQGWRGEWRRIAGTEDDETRVELIYEHAAGEWPWDYEARQLIELDAEGLSVRLSCRNRSAEPMPCGLGLHPYFPCGADAELDTTVTHAWTIDADVLPVDRVSADGRYDLRRRRICGQDLDNGFDGWSSQARIFWPARGLALELSSPDAERFQVYSPVKGGLFVAEPVQNANAALNRPQDEWPAAGLRLLQRDEEAVLRVRFRVIASDA